MKRSILAAMVTIAMYAHVNAQTTNTFPSSGNVGIGTLSPAAGLDVTNGAIRIAGGYGASYSIDGAYIGWNTSTGGGGGETSFINNIGGGNLGGFTFDNTTRSSVTTRLMTILGSGNVGIGITSPTDKFHVFGTSDHQLAIDASGQYSTLDFMHGGAVKTQFYWDNTFSNFNMQSTTSLLLQPAGGNIGIGTDSPASLFQVDDGCTKASIGDASGSGLNYGTSYLGFNASRSGTNWLTNKDGNNNNGGGVIYSSIFGDMYFSIIPTAANGSGQSLTDTQVKNTIAMRIDHTDGAVYAKQIYVQTSGWPDFVFKKNYSLRPLSEVKSYIEQNQHLPDMPAAEKVEKDGINLGEMNKALLKKIEELTLYLIEKDKQLQSQEEKIKQQQQTNQVQAEQLQQVLQRLGTIEHTVKITSALSQQ